MKLFAIFKERSSRMYLTVRSPPELSYSKLECSFEIFEPSLSTVTYLRQMARQSTSGGGGFLRNLTSGGGGGLRLSQKT